MRMRTGNNVIRWVLLTVFSVVMQLPHAGFAQTAATYHARADQGLQSFVIKFWNGGQQYLEQDYPSSNSLTGYWTFAQGWDALLDGVERTGGQQYAGLIESFYLGQNQRGWYSGYYDDECWMTLALIRAYDLTTNATYLNQAQTLYADIEGGWDHTCCGSVLGGVWWDKAHTQKATAANAGAALAGARLYQRTGNVNFLKFAELVFSYWFTKMVNPTTFQVCDHIQTDGTKVWWRFTYNEGLMIGASVELNRATGSASYLANANNIANFMINNEIVSTAYGNALYDGSNTGCGGDCHQFKGPAYRYLMLLFQQDTSKTAYSHVLKAGADAIWNLARDASGTVFAVNWAGPTQSAVDELQDDEACMALSLYASQAGAYPGSGIPANQYEAENATVHNIGLEANGAGFTGWGYLAGWNGNGQSVDFHVNFPKAGGRTLTFRYAAGAGDASRLIRINGVNVFLNQKFAGTGSWTNYNVASVSCDFSAGTNTISMVFDSAHGSANYLNLDNLTVTDLSITGITVLPGGLVQLSWNAVSGQTYHVQFASTPGGSSWSNLNGTIPATSNSASATDTVGANSQRLYRVINP